MQMGSLLTLTLRTGAHHLLQRAASVTVQANPQVMRHARNATVTVITATGSSASEVVSIMVEPVKYATVGRESVTELLLAKWRCFLPQSLLILWRDRGHEGVVIVALTP